jgi:hypothetical protein
MEEEREERPPYAISAAPPLSIVFCLALTGRLRTPLIQHSACFGVWHSIGESISLPLSNNKRQRASTFALSQWAGTLPRRQECLAKLSMPRGIVFVLVKSGVSVTL